MQVITCSKNSNITSFGLLTLRNTSVNQITKLIVILEYFVKLYVAII